MHSRYGRFTVTFIDNSTLYNCIDAEAVAMKESRPLNVVRNERNDELARCFKDDKWDNFSEMAHADFKDQLHNNFKNLLRVYKINLIVNSKDGSSLIADKYNSNPSWFIDKLSWLSIGQNIFNVMLLLLVIPVLWLFSFRKKLFKLPTAALFIMALEGIGLFIYFSSGLCFFQGDRYYVVFYPLTIVSVFVCIDYLRKQKSKG